MKLLCISVAALALAGLLAPLSLPTSHASTQSAPQDSPEAFIDLEFPGGSAAEYVEAIRHATGPISIAVMNPLDDIPMPAVSLHGVDPGSALKLLEGERTGSKGQWNTHVRQHGTVFAIYTELRRPAASAAQDMRIVSVSDVLDDHIQAADLLTAIETTLNVIDAGTAPATVRFHEETGLLIARGSIEQMNAISSVIDQMRDRKERLSTNTRLLMSRLNEFRANLEAAQSEAARATARVDALEHELSRLRQVNAELHERLAQSHDVISSLRSSQPGP